METEQSKAVAVTERRLSLLETMGARFSMEANKFAAAVVATCFPSGQATHEQLAAFLAVAHEYGLNPFTREIFAFPSKGGGIVPIVSIDGWVKLCVTNPDFAGMEFHPIYPLKADGQPDMAGKWYGCRCVIFRKSFGERSAADVTEYFDECYRNTDPWNKMPRRMMRHKALKEAARYAFGYAGITDEDEGRDIINITPESSQMEASTAKTADKLKGKIGAAKEKATPAAAAPTQEALPATPEPAAPTQAPAEPPDDDLSTPTPAAPAPEPPPVALITEAQRLEFLNKVGEKTKIPLPDNVKAAIKTKLNGMGFNKTTEITTDQFPTLMQWAENFKL